MVHSGSKPANHVHSLTLRPTAWKRSTLLSSFSWSAFDTAGNLYIADTDDNVIREINLTGSSRRLPARKPGYGGDSGSATLAMLDSPRALPSIQTASSTLPIPTTIAFAK